MVTEGGAEKPPPNAATRATTSHPLAPGAKCTPFPPCGLVLVSFGSAPLSIRWPSARHRSLEAIPTPAQLRTTWSPCPMSISAPCPSPQPSAPPPPHVPPHRPHTPDRNPETVSSVPMDRKLHSSVRQFCDNPTIMRGFNAGCTRRTTYPTDHTTQTGPSLASMQRGTRWPPHSRAPQAVACALTRFNGRWPGPAPWPARGRSPMPMSGWLGPWETRIQATTECARAAAPLHKWAVRMQTTRIPCDGDSAQQRASHGPLHEGGCRHGPWDSPGKTEDQFGGAERIRRSRGEGRLSALGGCTARIPGPHEADTWRSWALEPPPRPPDKRLLWCRRACLPVRPQASQGEGSGGLWLSHLQRF